MQASESAPPTVCTGTRRGRGLPYRGGVRCALHGCHSLKCRVSFSVPSYKALILHLGSDGCRVRVRTRKQREHGVPDQRVGVVEDLVKHRPGMPAAGVLNYVSTKYSSSTTKGSPWVCSGGGGDGMSWFDCGSANLPRKDG